MYVSKHSIQDKTDQELVVLTLKEGSWYRYLMERYEAKLMRYIRRICRVSKEDAEDILEEVFIKAYLHLNDFDTSLSFSSWIYKIAHNEAMSYVRKLNARPKVVYHYEDQDPSVFNVLSEDIDTKQKIDNEYLKKNIMEILDDLDEKYRTVLILRYLEDKNYQEISDILRKPIGTVGTLLSRAKKCLKAEMKKNRDFL